MSRTVRPDAISLAAYHACTRRVSVALLYVAPLGVLHEVALRAAEPNVRNAAELSVKELFWYLGPGTVWLQAALALLVLYALWRVLRMRLPVLRMYLPFLVECMLWALLLGPLISILLDALPLQARAHAPAAGAVPDTLAGAILCSIGAGLYEELLFRWIALGGAFVVLHRAARMQRGPALVLAVLGSAALFSVYHHVGPHGAPWQTDALLFRGLAGILLGVLFAFRGLGVVVYLHALYDIVLDLRLHLSPGAVS